FSWSLCLFCFLSFFPDGQAQALLKQSPISITKGQNKTARIECKAEGISNFQSEYIHWYRHIPSKAPERILFIGEGQASYDDSSYRNKYSASKTRENTCAFSVNDINSNDEGTYYCAYWQSHRTIRPQAVCTESLNITVFRTGTKLIVSGKIFSKVSSQPAHSEILQKNQENQTTYVCLIEKFYPEVIRVTWTDEAHNEVTDNVVQGDPWKATEEGEYSISTWLTVSAANKDKNYHCKYEHESKKHSLQTQGTYYMLKISFYVLLQISLFLCNKIIEIMLSITVPESICASWCNNS
uniref:Ig-like domain-containing protein n=1 Tax=Accipiter nisus TaxID=211598 RepID=A0A8B9MBI9_9AVES